MFHNSKVMSSELSPPFKDSNYYQDYQKGSAQLHYAVMNAQMFNINMDKNRECKVVSGLEIFIGQKYTCLEGNS